MRRAPALAALALCIACVSDPPTSAADASTGDAAPPDADAADGSTTDKDASSGGDAGSGVGPNGLPNTVLWLSADLGVTHGSNGSNQVTRWADRSGLGNDAVADTTSACAGHGPAAPNGGGSSALEFAGAACLSIHDSPSLSVGTDDFAIFVVGAYTNDPSKGEVATWWSKSAQGSHGPLGLRLQGNTATTAAERLALLPTTEATATATPAPNDGKLHHFTALQRGSDLVLRIDGKSTTSKSLGPLDVSAGSVDGFVGAVDGNAQLLNGKLFALVIARGTVSDAQAGAVEQYFLKQFGAPGQ